TLIGTERTIEVSSGWSTISLSLVTSLPSALTIMSTCATANQTPAAATSAIMSHNTKRCRDTAARSVCKSYSIDAGGTATAIAVHRTGVKFETVLAGVK